MRVIKCHHIQVPSGKRMLTATDFKWPKPNDSRPYEQWTSALPGTPLCDGHIARASNGFIGAACFAYSNHLPLVFNPWHVWIVILQNVSKYVNDHAEQVRHLIVAHEGKKEICVDAISIVDGIARNFEEMGKDCKLDLGVDLSLNTRIEDHVSRTVMQLAALDTVKAYFSYSFMLCCGVPEYHIEGTHEDWQQLIDKVQQFSQLGPEVSAWVSELVPVLQQIQTSEDPDFWTRCCTVNEVGSGGEQAIDGWILAFFLYYNGGFVKWNAPSAEEKAKAAEHFRLRKQLAELQEQYKQININDKSPENEQRLDQFYAEYDLLERQLRAIKIRKGIQTTDLMQTALSRVPFAVTDIDGTKYDVEMISGLVGVAQDADTCAVRPLPGYIVWRTPAKE